MTCKNDYRPRRRRDDCGDPRNSKQATGLKPVSADELSVQGDGVAAFEKGDVDSVCPHPHKHGWNYKRVWWMRGYWAAHIAGHVKSVTLKEMLS